MKDTLLKTLLSTAVLAAMTNGAFAAGTTSGTPVNNTATISYQVGGVAQTDIKSSPDGNSTPGTAAGAPTTFVVDKKIDLTVTQPASSTTVSPASTGDEPTNVNTLTFSVTNTGNSVEDFSLSTLSAITTGDDFDAIGCTANPAALSALAVDTPTDVVVTCNIPNTSTNVSTGKTSIVALIAEVTTPGLTNDTAIADNPATVQTVFADTAGTNDAVTDAKHSAQGTYVVSAADLNVTKTSIVISDPINTIASGNAANAKRIPGAIIEYTITVENPAGGATATGVAINDTVQADLDTVTCTTSGDGIASCSVTGNAVSTPTFDLTAGQTATLKIRGTIK